MGVVAGVWGVGLYSNSWGLGGGPQLPEAN